MKKKKLRDILAANKWFIIAIIGLVILPIGLLGLALGLYIDSFSFKTWDAVNSLLIAFIAVLSVELILAIIYVATYKKRETLQEIRQEMKIEELGNLFEESGLVDSQMRKAIKKKNFVLMTRQEIIEFCKTLNYNIETQVQLRQYDESPDNISAGDRIYCFLYETHGIIKLMVKNNSLFIDIIKAEHPHIEQVGKVSDWYEVLLDGTFTDNQQVKDILINAYEFVIGSHFSLINGTYIMKGGYDTDDEIESIAVKAFKEPDEFVEEILEKKHKLSELTLLTREMIADYVEKNVKSDCTAYVIRRKGFALYSLKAQHPEKHQSRSYGLLYERENVVKMWLRLDPEFYRAKAKMHPTLTRARFPKGKDWYTIILDETFDEDVKISELIWAAYSYMCEEYFKTPIA